MTQNSLSLDDDEKGAVIRKLIDYAIMPASEQRRLVAEWMRCAEMRTFSGSSKTRYLLPGAMKPVCGSAVARLLYRKR